MVMLRQASTPNYLNILSMNISSPGYPGFRADGRIRTADQLITNQLLYQLSYIGIKLFPAEIPANFPFGKIQRNSY